MQNIHQSLKYSPKEIQKMVLTNIIKMITERGLLKEGNKEKNIDSIINTQSQDNQYKIKLDTKYKDNEYIIIKLLNYKLISLTNSAQAGLIDFLTQHKNMPGIIVPLGTNKKIEQAFKNNYPLTEIFIQKELMIHVSDMIFIPKHIALTPEEQEEVHIEYKVKQKEMPKVKESDRMIRHLNIKIGSMVKIIRPSDSTVLTPYYRLVMKG
jgi:DNA-directed RNA polymerase subunit H (RpoH/RPB5)